MKQLLRKLLRFSRTADWPIVALTNRGRYRIYHVRNYFIYLNVSEYFTMLRRTRKLHEPEKHDFISSLLEPGMAFIDVGANKGDFSLLAASVLRGRGRVIAVEPEPENCRWLRKSIHANGFENIELIEGALSDESGTAVLYLGKKSGWHTLVEGQKAWTGQRIEVETFRLDEIVSGLDRVDAIKIDVEGGENKVLDGAVRTIDTYRPIVILDLHPQLGADIGAIDRLFRQLNYHCFTMSDLERPISQIPNKPVDILLRPAR